MLETHVRGNRLGRGALLLLTLCFAAIGCARGVGVQRIGDTEWFLAEARSALTSPEPSERTKRFVRRLALDKRYPTDRDAAFLDMHRRLVTNRDRQVAFHLAELTFLEAGHCRYSAREKKSRYLVSAEYAWAFLFDTELGPPPNPYDSNVRLACDFYNRSIGKIIELHAKGQTPFVAEPIEHEWLTGKTTVSFGLLELPLPADAFDEFLSAYRFKVRGLANPARFYGLGTPCLARYSPQRRDELPDKDRFMPDIRQTMPVTTILRFEGSIVDRGEHGGHRTASAEFYDSYDRSTIDVNGHEVALESDLTTPFAYMLSQTKKQKGLMAMLDPAAFEQRDGLSMMRPYDPDRIPLIFVHGLMSSPMTWVKLVSELMSSETIRKHYQIWFFQYATGYPVPYSSSLLRTSLQAIADTFDPDGTNPNFERTVVVGHSMGGLLTRMMLASSGNDPWETISDEPFDELDLNDEDRELIEKSLFFERMPFIARSIFISTPHRGSVIATNWVGRIGQKLIAVPSQISSASSSLRDALTQTESGIRYPNRLRKLTSIQNLSPKNPVLTVLDEWGLPDDVPYHSIIGNHLKAGVGEGGTDTVVPYWSSHLEGAQSELIIKSDHGAHQHQEAILEVYRILLLHLRENGILPQTGPAQAVN